MATPECSHHTATPKPEFEEALTDIQRRIELADADENPIERTRKLEVLFEERDSLETEPDKSAHKQDLP